MKSAMKSILVTGGTGFLGKRTVECLLERYQVTVLTRQNVEGDLNKKKQHNRLKYLHGDLTSWHAGLGSEFLKTHQFDLMLHLAGLYDLRASQADCYTQNIVATNHALALAQRLGISKFIFSSSVAAAINSAFSPVKPTDLQFDSPFPDFYSESKALAEKLIRNWNAGPSLKLNLRLGVLIGDSLTGEIERIDGPYYAFQAFEKLRPVIENWPGFLPLPGKEEQRLPFVPVNIAATAISRFCDWCFQADDVGSKYFHLTPAVGAEVREFYQSIFRGQFRGQEQELKKIVLLESLPQDFLKPVIESILGFPQGELTYLLNFPTYDSSSTQQILGEYWCPEFREYESNLWRGYERFISNRRN